MSDEDDRPCPQCGALRTMGTAGGPTPIQLDDQGNVEVAARWVCDNPDCKLYEDSGAIDQPKTAADVQRLPDEPTSPGSTGGDNGGA